MFAVLSCRSCFKQLPSTGSRTGLKSGRRCQVGAMPSAETGEFDLSGEGGLAGVTSGEAKRVGEPSVAPDGLLVEAGVVVRTLRTRGGWSGSRIPVFSNQAFVQAQATVARGRYPEPVAKVRFPDP